MTWNSKLLKLCNTIDFPHSTASLKIYERSGRQQLTPIILAIQKAEIRKIMV
jgi:hypothetical protein